jgi:glycosyltransferase involved in cell wall biosynthesis
MPEIAGDAACLVNPFDVSSIRQGILKVIDDEGYRNTLIHNGRKNKVRFSAQEIACQYYKLYQDLLVNYNS